MSVSYFYSLTPRQFDNIVTGRKRFLQDEFQNSWEQTRSVVYATYLSYETKGSKVSPQELLPFNWDEKQTEIEIIPQSQNELRERFEKSLR